MQRRKSKFGGTIRFKELMEQLNKDLESLSNLVIRMIEGGYKALNEDNEDLFKEIKNDLIEVHERCFFVEDSVQSSLALHQPFASDLRYILSTLKITNEVHRSAHDAVHIARSTLYINIKQQSDIVKRIVELSKKSSIMFQNSIEAFRNRKELDYGKWTKLDDEVDDLHKEIIADIIETIQNKPSWAKSGTSY